MRVVNFYVYTEQLCSLRFGCIFYSFEDLNVALTTLEYCAYVRCKIIIKQDTKTRSEIK